MIFYLITIPALAGMASFFIRSDRFRRALLVMAACFHLSLTAAAWCLKPIPGWGQWLILDDLGLLFLTLTSVLFFAASIYGLGYLKREVHGKLRDFEENVFFANAPEARFCGCLLLFLATMTWVCVSQHFGLLWVAVEATTLVSAPLIYYHRHHRSLEATWKYLLICSVGIALALIGNFFLAVAASGSEGQRVPMFLSALVEHADQLSTPWLKASFLFFIVGYGTKMGLAPLHTWLPDAHSEAPSMVSALLSGALLNCAFLGILRAHQVGAAAGLGSFNQEILLGLGLISMAVAAVFILAQKDYKRMLAYSSVEHMGILALGIGLGGVGSYGAILHAVNHSMTKAMLFFVAGNILAVYQTKSSMDVRGVLKILPVSGVLWIMGFLAITGSPPFGLFLSEFTVLKSALDQGHPWVAGAYLALLALIFVGMSILVLRMAQGSPAGEVKIQNRREMFLLVFPAAALGLGVLSLGLYVPPILDRVLHQIAQQLGGF